MTRTVSVLALFVGVCLFTVTTTRLVAATNTLIMSGLNNPRGLAIGPNGALYLAEAGSGGAGPCLVNPANETRCFGLTGSITRLLNGVQERIVRGLPSHALPGGDAAAGPNDVSLQGAGGVFVAMGLGLNPVDRRLFPRGGEMFGKLLQISASGESGRQRTFRRTSGMSTPQVVPSIATHTVSSLYLRCGSWPMLVLMRL